MDREDIVTVRGKDGEHAAFAAGQRFALVIPAKGSTNKWSDGSPITRAEFEAVLADGPFEIVG